MNPGKEIKTAVFNGKCFNHFGITPMSASLYGDKIEDIVQVEIEIAKNQKRPTHQEQRDSAGADYWGWFDNEEKKFTLIWAQLFLLDMCFPYGLKAEEERDRGKAYRLNVKQVDKKLLIKTNKNS